VGNETEKIWLDSADKQKSCSNKPKITYEFTFLYFKYFVCHKTLTFFNNRREFNGRRHLVSKQSAFDDLLIVPVPRH